MKISATDPDVGSNAQITYSLHGPGAEEFRLGPHTGETWTCEGVLLSSAGRHSDPSRDYVGFVT